MADTALAHRSFEGGCRVCKLVPGPCGVSQCLFFTLVALGLLWPGIDFNLSGNLTFSFFYQKSGTRFEVCCCKKMDGEAARCEESGRGRSRRGHSSRWNEEMAQEARLTVPSEAVEQRDGHGDDERHPAEGPTPSGGIGCLNGRHFVSCESQKMGK